VIPSTQDSLRLSLDADALFNFFESLKRERRKVGILSTASGIEPRRRAKLVELVIALNFDDGWGASQGTRVDNIALMTRMFAPLLAESPKAREALHYALKSSPPGTFNVGLHETVTTSQETLVEKAKQLTTEEFKPKPTTFRPQVWAALVAMIVGSGAIALVIEWRPPLRCFFDDQEQCSPQSKVIQQAASPPTSIQIAPQNPAPSALESTPTDRALASAYSQALGKAAQTLEARNWLLTPRELAEEFASAAGPSAQQILAAMFAVAPSDPDVPVPSNAEGLAELRRYAAAAASILHQKNFSDLLDLTTTQHDNDGQAANDKSVGAVLNAFVNQRAASATPHRPAVAGKGSPNRWVALLGLCAAVVWVLMAMRRSMRVDTAHLVRTLGKIKGERADVRVQALGFERGAAPGVGAVATKMSRRRHIVGRRIDADRTIRASVKRLGFLVPQFQPKSAPPEYVFLLSRSARDDHTRDRFAAIVDALKQAGANATRYDYSHDPRILFRGDDWDWKRALPLVQLYDRHPEARLIFASDGDELVNPVDSRPYAWLRSLSVSREIALLSPTFVRRNSSAPKSLASNLGWLTEQATLSGLVRVADRFEPETARPAPLSVSSTFLVSRPLPTYILNSSTRLLSDAALDPVDQEILVADLRYFLGNDGFYWLAATTIYPELRYDITIFLGLRLGVFNDDCLNRLASLPWFHIGRFPDWMRWLVFDSIGPKEQTQAQDAVAGLIEGAQRSDGTSRTEQVEGAAVLGRGEPRPTKIELSIWRQKIQGMPIPLDSVTLELLSRGGRTDLLTRVTGRALEEILGTASQSPWMKCPPILLPALAWILGSIALIPKPWSTSEITGAWLPLLALSVGAALTLIFWHPHLLWRAVAAVPRAAALTSRLLFPR
jgi:hypothetical protein